MNLFLALCAEHKQRTGHNTSNFAKRFSCDVCLYLLAEQRAHQKAEKEYYENLENSAREAGLVEGEKK